MSNELKVVPCSETLIEELNSKISEIVLAIQSETFNQHPHLADELEVVAKRLCQFADHLNEHAGTVRRHARLWKEPVQW